MKQAKGDRLEVSEKPVMVFMTAGSVQEAEKIAKTLVSEKLCACVNVCPKIVSIYRWQGKIEKAQEAFMIGKTVMGKAEKLIRRVKALHSYDVPEIIFIPIVRGEKSYLNWLTKAVVSRVDTK